MKLVSRVCHQKLSQHTTNLLTLTCCCAKFVTVSIVVAKKKSVAGITSPTYLGRITWRNDCSQFAGDENERSNRVEVRLKRRENAHLTYIDSTRDQQSLFRCSIDALLHLRVFEWFHKRRIDAAFVTYFFQILSSASESRTTEIGRRWSWWEIYN